MTDEAHVAMLEIPCPYCNAGAGEWCVTVTGLRSGYLHSARFYEWRAREAESPDWFPMP